jgi:hypothetical protein
MAEVAVAVLNLNKGVDRWGERAVLVARGLARLPPDVNGFQEVDLHIDQGNWLCRRVNDLLAFHTEARYTKRSSSASRLTYGRPLKSSTGGNQTRRVPRHGNGRTVGRVAMEAVISRIRQQERNREIRFSYHPDNTFAAHLYEGLGFRHTGELQEGEIVVRLASTGGINS